MIFTFVKCQLIRQSIFRVADCDIYVCEVSMDKTRGGYRISGRGVQIHKGGFVSNTLPNFSQIFP